MRAIKTILIIAAAAAAVPPRPTSAQPAPAEAPRAEAPPAASDGGKTWSFGLEPRFGVLVPTSKLHTFVAGGLELDYAIRRFTIGADVTLSQPRYTSTVMDARVPGGEAEYTIAQTELVVGLLAAYRFSDGPLVPRVGAGPILQMLKTNETTNLAPGDNTSTQTKLGVQLAGGIDYLLGPGYLAIDLRVLYSGLDTMLTGSSNAGGLALMVGYRFVF